MTDHSQVVTDTISDFISRLGLNDEVTVSTQYDEESNLYQVLLQTQNPALLIGYHGENLSSLQLIVGQHLHAKLNEWINLSLNVNDYRERRETSLHSLADSAVARVIATGQPHSLPPLPAGERRLIHMYLADHPQVTTSSQGVGRARSIVVSPK
jgi:spoIIIJ-associated protein